MTRTTPSTLALLLMAAGGLIGAHSAWAAGPRIGDSSTYQDEVAVCAHIQQDRAACIREAGAARQEARRGGLTSAPDYLQNALARCQPQPPAERIACEQRVRGTGMTSIDGSVLGGGVIRETVTPIPAPIR
jgi:hypothetical protein